MTDNNKTMAKRKKKKNNLKISAFIFVAVCGIIAFAVGIYSGLSHEGFFEAGFSSKGIRDLRSAGVPDSREEVRKTPSKNRPSSQERFPRRGPEQVPEEVEEEGARSKRPGARVSEVTGKVAIIIDDFGNSWDNVEDFCQLDFPITLAILPRTPYAGKISWKARQSGKEVILHLPLENHSGIYPGPGTITTSMTRDEVRETFLENLNSVPGVVGFNNHEGSKATEDDELMNEIMKLASENDLFFVDSMTSSKSLGRLAASRQGIPCARRNIFLDNENNEEYIEGQIEKLASKAQREGYAIGIGHCRQTTLKVLKETYPGLEKRGIRFVFVSELVR